jgi:hypothetical protein
MHVTMAIAIALQANPCLCSVSRGLARPKSKYYACLQNADAQRADERDTLSEGALREFIHFSLEVLLDQITCMDD